MNFKEELYVLKTKNVSHHVLEKNTIEFHEIMSDAEWETERKKMRKRRQKKTFILLLRSIMYCLAGIIFFMAILFISKGFLIMPCILGVFYSIFVSGVYFVLEKEQIE